MASSNPPSRDAAWRQRYGPWALVVGGAQGLGAAWVEALSEAGLCVASLDRASAALSAQHQALQAVGRTSLPIELELEARPLMPQVLDALKGREVGLLVCNAAVAHVGPFLERAVQDHLQSLEVNCAATLELTHGFGRQLAARGRGGIVLTSSLAGFQGTAQVASYAATKAFSLVLGEALGEELRPLGVDVLVLAPGATRTPGYVSSLPQDDGGPLMEPAETVREALDALGRQPLIVPGRGNRAARFLLGRLLSRAAAVRLLGKAMRKRYPA